MRISTLCLLLMQPVTAMAVESQSRVESDPFKASSNTFHLMYEQTFYRTDARAIVRVWQPQEPSANLLQVIQLLDASGAVKSAKTVKVGAPLIAAWATAYDDRIFIYLKLKDRRVNREPARVYEVRSDLSINESGIFFSEEEVKSHDTGPNLPKGGFCHGPSWLSP